MDFKSLPLYVQLIIILVVCVAMGGLAYWFVYKGQYETIEKQEKKLAGLQKEIQQGLIMEAQLPEFKKEVKKLEAKLQTLKRILPEQREVAELIQKVKNLADLTNLTIINIKGQSLRPIEFYAEVPWTFEIEGTYHSLAGFFDKISKFSRIINITQTNIKAIQAKSGKGKVSQANTIHAKFVATTFVFIEESADGGDGAAGRRSRKKGKRGKQ
jgi:type IV pilus assembly protein PilO